MKTILIAMLLALSLNVQAQQHKFFVVQTGPEVTKAVHLLYMNKGYDCTQEAFITRCFNDETEKYVEVTVIGRDKSSYLTNGFLKTNIEKYETEIGNIMSKVMDSE